MGLRTPTADEIAACYFVDRVLPIVLANHELFMARQMVDSTITTTRVYWRRKLGLPEHIVNDPRSLAKCAGGEDRIVGRGG